MQLTVATVNSEGANQVREMSQASPLKYRILIYPRSPVAAAEDPLTKVV